MYEPRPSEANKALVVDQVVSVQAQGNPGKLPQDIVHQVHAKPLTGLHLLDPLIASLQFEPAELAQTIKQCPIPQQEKGFV